MANREELAIIRGARAGRAESQLELGRLYLFGSAGLPKSLPTALHWLDRAARQGCVEAWQLIGNHIPLDLARQSPDAVTGWYERAYDGGLARAGLVYAQLVLGGERVAPGQRAKALRALEDAGRGGFPEAQWLLAREHGAAAPRSAAPVAGMPAAGALAAGASERPIMAGESIPRAPASAPPTAGSRPGAPAPAPERAGQRWLRRAADNGVTPAQFVLLEEDWNAGNWQAYLERALPLARVLADAQVAQSRACARLAPDEATLLSRCARLVDEGAAVHDVEAGELHAFWELAAAEQDRHAQFALGLWCARMRIDGRRLPGNSVGSNGAANFKKAVRWLQQAGEQGLAEAWYALSRIYVKPEFSQRNVVEAQKYLERAADMGYRDAQLECGNAAWRARRENEGNDVRAVFWLQKAALQGCAKAAAMLRKIAPRSRGAWPDPGLLSGRNLSDHPLLAARLELAQAFGLSRAEALLLDIRNADHGHCLVVDIRASYGRSRRRLISVETAQERQLLDRIVRLFESVDCGPGGPEGNYRQRLYRLRTLLPEMGGPDNPLDFDLAA
jgi:TPR repeat protein